MENAAKLASKEILNRSTEAQDYENRMNFFIILCMITTAGFLISGSQDILVLLAKLYCSTMIVVMVVRFRAFLIYLKLLLPPDKYPVATIPNTSNADVGISMC